MECYDDEQHQITIKQSELDKITRLEISDYDGQGEEFYGLTYFRNLEYLDIHGSTAFHTKELETLDKLIYLDMSDCNAEDKEYDLSFIRRLKKLEYLNTSKTLIKNEAYIKELPSLKEWKN